MKVKSKNIYLSALLCVLMALVAVLCGASYAKTDLSLADGGYTAYPPNGDAGFTLDMTLDVNGEDATARAEDSLTTVVGNNDLGYRRRAVNTSALLQAYAEKNNVENRNAYNDNNFGLFTSSTIYNSFGEYLDVSRASQSGNLHRQLIFEAKKYKRNPNPYIAVVFTNLGLNDDLPEQITVYIRFTIDSTFTPAGSASLSFTNVYLDEDIKASADGSQPAGYRRIELVNNQDYVLALDGNYGIVNKPLRYGSSMSLDTLESTTTLLNETVDNTKEWLLRDVSNFVITDAAIGEIVSGSDIRVTGGADGLSNPVITIKVSFDETDVNSTFWTRPHYLTFKLVDKEGNQPSVTFYKRVYFVTGTPTYKKDYGGMPVKLNYSSEYQYVGIYNGSDSYVEKGNSTTTPSDYVAAGVEEKAAGYSQVRVVPSNLVEYPTRGSLSFGPQTDKYTVDDIVEVSPVFHRDEAGDTVVDYYLISAIGTGSAVVEFPIKYAPVAGASSRDMTVPVVFNVFGNYSLIFRQMDGRKDRTLSTMVDFSDKDGFGVPGFRELASGDFYLNFAESDNKDIVTISRATNSITLHPHSTGEANLRFGFMDLQGNQIYIKTTIQIEYDRGTIFATWTTIQLVLFFIGLGIVALALILFIVWMFIRGVSKRRQEENETTAPTSAYIIKLNSTIAASQAQQRIVTTQAFNTAQTQMLALGAGPTTTGVHPSDALQLSAGVNTTSAPAGAETQGIALNGGTGAQPQQPAGDDIYIPLSDDELLERIFAEKYEPRGMARRSFFKSKDLQSRELEKEKARIRDDVRSGMTIEEASKSLSERQAAQANAAVTTDAETKTEEIPEDSILVILGFDPDSPLLEEAAPAPIEATDGMIEEEVALKNSELRLERIEKELAVLQERLDKTVSEIDKAKSVVDEKEEALKAKEDSNEALRKSIEDLEFKLATAKNKEKDKITKDIENKEHVIASNKEIITKLTEELTRKRSNYDILCGIRDKYDTRNTETGNARDKAQSEVEEARENYRVAQELLEKARKAQETKEKRSRLRPMLESVNTLDADLRNLENQIEKDTKEKDEVKANASELQKQMLSTNDIAAVKELTEKLSVLNKRVSELDKKIAAANKSKADGTIRFNGERRKTNEFIDKEELEVEDVVAEEDDVIGKMAFDEYIKSAHEERENAEKSLSELQAEYDELVSGYDAEVMNMAVRATEAVKAAEDALAETQASLAALNEQIEAASDDDKLMLSIDQMSLNEQLEQNQRALDELQASAAKEKVEYQMQYDNKLEETKQRIEEMQAAYDEASRKVDESMNKINPLDLILSGSGVISQDRKRMEAENLKKQLELSKSAMEQAKLQAKQAQMDAEKAIIDAQRASDESKAEAERAAQEAIAKAEEARLAAEQKAAEDSEQMRLEMERARQEAEEAKLQAAEEAERARKEAEEQAEQARKEAEEQAERARKEAEEQAEQARREAEEQAERARKEAEEQAEQARKEAEEQAERARKEAEEQAEQARKEAEEQAEQARKDAEEEKRRLEEEKKRSEEEAERARKEAEEQAEKDKANKEAEEKRIREKIERKKAIILEMRDGLKNITDEASAKVLKEKFYNEQVKLDDDEKSTPELTDLLNKCMDDADHAAEVAMYKALANKAPKRVVKKVTERINKIPKKRSSGARPGSRSAHPGARPTRPGSRPSRPGARPSRPGARPTRPGSRPSRPGGSPRPRQ